MRESVDPEENEFDQTELFEEETELKDTTSSHLPEGIPSTTKLRDVVGELEERPPLKQYISDSERRRIKRRLKIVELKQKIAPSWNSQLDPVAFIRSFPVLLFVEADEESEIVGRDLTQLVADELRSTGFSANFGLGPEKGSYLITLFGESQIPEIGQDFRDRVGRLCSRFADLANEVLSSTTFKRTASILIIAGGTATLVQHHINPKQNAPVKTTQRAPVPVDWGVVVDLGILASVAKSFKDLGRAE